MNAAAPKTSRCRSCQVEIIWARTEHGRRKPLNATPVADPTTEARGIFVLRETDHQDGPLAISAWGLEGTEPHHLSHLATCPFAGRHRRRPS